MRPSIAGLALAGLIAAGCGGGGSAVSSSTASGGPPSPSTTAESGPSIPAAWRRLPAAPIAVPAMRTAVWTGSQLIVFGRVPRQTSGGSGGSVSEAAIYTPATAGWRRLTPPPGPTGSYEGGYSAVWTGTEMLVWGPFDVDAFSPATGRWRKLPPAPTGYAGAVVVWTGHEMIGWGGGCCGDASADGAAYNPATNTWRRLARSPLTGGQSPTGVWTGRELIIFGVRNPDGPPLRMAAAYDPATDAWRMLAPLPAPRYGADAVWDGREVLVIGGANAGVTGPPPAATVGFAYDPGTNRWGRLPPMDFGRSGGAAVWTGSRLLVWGGGTGILGSLTIPPHGVMYDPSANRWSSLPAAPIAGRIDPAALWTGHMMIVWGGETADYKNRFADGAVFTPATP